MPVAAAVIVKVAQSDGWTHALVVVSGLAAVATVVLAIFTAQMAAKTKAVAERTGDEASAVAAQVTAAREALQASVRPWLTSAPRWTQVQEVTNNVVMQHGLIEATFGAAGLSGSVPIRNVGPGIALIDADRSWVLGHNREGHELQRYTNLRTSTPVVPPGEIAELVFEVRPSAAWPHLISGVFFGVGLTGDFALDVVFTDWAGEQSVAARVFIGRGDVDGEWFVYRIEYRDSSTEKLIARVDSVGADARRVQ